MFVTNEIIVAYFEVSEKNNVFHYTADLLLEKNEVDEVE
jgi:hypothetical protein